MVLVAALTVACLIPFANKPIAMDDPLFVWSARQIERRPWDFYGFDVNWYETAEPMHRVNQNPPLASYVLAAIIQVFGERPIFMHLAFLTPCVALALGTYQIAARLCPAPQAASLIALLAPVTLVSATSLMCDVLMLAFWVWAIVFWLWALDGKRAGWALAAGMCVSLSLLSKYFGLALVPLLTVYALMVRPRWLWWLPALLLPIGVAVVYEWYARHLYGHGLLTGAVGYVAGRPETSLGQRALQGMLFLGGSLATTLFFAPLLWRRTTVLIALASAATVAGTWLALGGIPPDPIDDPAVGYLFPPHVVIYLLAALQILAVALLEAFKRRNAASMFLLLWFLGVLAFATLANWAITARTFLPLVPPVAILIVNQVYERQSNLPRLESRVRWALVASGVLAMAITQADVSQARSAHNAARKLAARYLPQSVPLWFLGHWGFQFYMEEQGARIVDAQRDVLAPGNLVIVPTNNTNVRLLPDDIAQRIDVIGFRASRFASTNSVQLRTKFYAASRRLSLPIVFGPVPPDLYVIYRVKTPFRLGALPDR
jgi:4-amino-4-deoxy-L-arabinose transferase-like glycosyltransferase